MKLTKSKAKKNLSKLIEKFKRELAAGQVQEYNEEATKMSFINPLLVDVLDWNVQNHDEVSLEEKISGGRVDYGLKIEGVTKIFVEAKAIKAHLERHLIQAVRYGYNKKSVPFVLLTDFEELKLFDVTVKPDSRNLLKGLKIDLQWNQYLEQFDKLWLLSKESVIKGELDKLLLVKPKDRIPVDKAVLEDLKKWRQSLAKDIFKNNPELFHSEDPDKDANYLKEINQRILDRIIFMRSCEDRGLVHRHHLKELFEERTETVGKNTMVFLREEFRHYNIIFDSDLFEPKDWEKNLAVDFNVMHDIILDTYNPYQFDVIPIDVLGNIYEQYLGYTVRLTDHQVKYELKPEVRKAGGVYYTPEYIVDYIVKNTVGKLLKELPSKKIKKLRILDPACGSGSFLIRAYEEMLNYYRDQKKKKPKSRGREPKLELKDEEAVPRLTMQEKSKILQEHIFGVDLDDQAVEVTKLSLMLKMLEGESGIIPGRSVLPMLDKNIRCGNSLISGDTLELKKYFGDDWYKVKPFNWNEEFRKIMVKEGGFDVVIGNPPYRRERDYKYLIDDIVITTFGQKWHDARMDLWYYFVHKGLDLLKNKGLLSFIVNSYWTSGQGARKLIDRIESECAMLQIFDFGNAKVFQNVSGRHMIFVLQKGGDAKQCKILRSVSESGVPCIILFVKHGTIESFLLSKKELFQAGKVFLQKLTTDIEIKMTGYPALAEVSETRQGIAENPSTINRKIAEKYSGRFRIGEGVFVLTEEEVRSLKLSSKERDFLRPYFDTRDLGRYFIPEKSLRFIFYLTKETMPSVNEYPVIKAHLSRFKPIMDVRRETRKGLNKWFHLHWPREERIFTGEKVLSVQMGARPIFVYSPTPAFVGFSVNVILTRPNSGVSNQYLTAILNSNLAWYWFKRYAKRRGVGLEINLNVLNRFPIRVVDFNNQSEKKLHDDLVALVDAMLGLNKKIQIAKGSKKDQLQRQIEKTDREIDDLVYRLYGITKQERKIIESSI